MMRAVAGLDSAKAGLALAQEQEKQARARLDAAIVRAPFDGLVVARAVAPGQIVRPGTPLLTLATGLDRLVVSVPLRADEAQRLAPSAKARVLLADTPDHVRSARLVRIEARADTQGQDRLAVFALDPPAPDAAKRRKRRRGSAQGPPRRCRHGRDRTSRARGCPAGSQCRAGLHPRWRRPRAGTIYVLAGKDDPRQVAVSTGVSDGRRTEILANGLEPGVQVITGRRAPTASLQGATGPDAKSGKP
jgi:HlyD family secretion protein